MEVKIKTRITCLTEFRQTLEVIGISKEYGSGMDECLQNEIAFLQDILKDTSTQQVEEAKE